MRNEKTGKFEDDGKPNKEVCLSIRATKANRWRLQQVAEKHSISVANLMRAVLNDIPDLNLEYVPKNADEKAALLEFQDYLDKRKGLTTYTKEEFERLQKSLNESQSSLVECAQSFSLARDALAQYCPNIRIDFGTGEITGEPTLRISSWWFARWWRRLMAVDPLYNGSLCDAKTAERVESALNSMGMTADPNKAHPPEHVLKSIDIPSVDGQVKIHNAFTKYVVKYDGNPNITIGDETIYSPQFDKGKAWPQGWINDAKAAISRHRSESDD